MSVIKFKNNGVWEEIVVGASIEADATLSRPGCAADAQVTGKAISDLDASVSERIEQAASNVLKYDIEQELTTEQKAQVRENIGAGTSNFSGNYEDLADKIASCGKFSTSAATSNILDSSTYHDEARGIYFKAVSTTNSYFTNMRNMGGAYKVIVDNHTWITKKSTIQLKYSTLTCLGNKFLYSVTERDTGEPFFAIMSSTNTANGLYFTSDLQDKNIAFYTTTTTSYKELNEVLIPDTFARMSDVEKVEALISDNALSEKIADKISEVLVEVYVQDEAPIDAPEGSIWIDADEDGLPNTPEDTMPNIHILNAATEDITGLDFSIYSPGDIVLVTMS